MENPAPKNNQILNRTIVISLITIVLAMSVVIAFLSVNRAMFQASPDAINVLAHSTNECVQCHKNATPGIVEQYGVSTMAAANVTCQNCHEVDENYPGSVNHEGTFVMKSPSTDMCKKCHTAEVLQFNQSRHGIPAYIAYNGTQGLTETQMALYQSIPEGQFAPDKNRNQIAVLEGEALTQFACKTCHAVGQPSPDGSVGQCQKCHLRHEFSLEQVRKPETCNACISVPIIPNGRFTTNLHTESLTPPSEIAGIGMLKLALWMSPIFRLQLARYAT